MVQVETLLAAAPAIQLNVADRLTKFARALPDSHAVVSPHRSGSDRQKRRRGASGAFYDTISFAELEVEVARVAAGLCAWGVPKGTRLALLVKPGIDFVTLVFALLRAGIVIVLVDPGLGRRNLIRCLSEAEPEGFVAIGGAQLARAVLRKKFPHARWNVTVGHSWFRGGKTLNELRIAGTQQRASSPTHSASFTATSADDSAAIIFTSGSTGRPKGVLYTQRMFDTQVAEIQSTYGIKLGEIDLACFPLFALFNAAMGVTTVLPKMDFSRPASADPKKLLAAAKDWQVSQAFASPALWRVLSDHCERTGNRIDSLRQVFSCGAPVPAKVLRATLAFVAKDAKMHTPYGATECLPVSTIEASEVIGETAARTDQGAGICVGRKFHSIDWRIIRITDEPISTIDEVEELPVSEIGELIVRGPQVSTSYVTRIEANAQSKIADPAGSWHRTGDVGYFDEGKRYWYCGRKSQRVRTRNGPLFTEKIEAVFNSLPGVRRSALVGVDSTHMQSPVVVIEPEERGIAKSSRESKRRQDELICEWYDIEPRLEHLWCAEQGYIPFAGFLFLSRLPVDIRHNAKINREWLSAWAAKKKQLIRRPTQRRVASV
jgi:acyl-CoA synthetase (AMP-forming)/AMP-acid ligase II